MNNKLFWLEEKLTEVVNRDGFLKQAVKEPASASVPIIITTTPAQQMQSTIAAGDPTQLHMLYQSTMQAMSMAAGAMANTQIQDHVNVCLNAIAGAERCAEAKTETTQQEAQVEDAKNEASESLVAITAGKQGVTTKVATINHSVTKQEEKKRKEKEDAKKKAAAKKAAKKAKGELTDDESEAISEDED